MAIAETTTKTAPSPTNELPYFGSLIWMARDPLQFMIDLRAEYGDVVQMQFPGRSIYVLYDPEDIKQILLTQANKVRKSSTYKALSSFLGNGLLTSDGDLWRTHRKLMQPAFHHQRIEEYADLMVTYTQEMMTEWDEQVDIYAEMTRLTLYIVVKTLFNTDVRETAREIGELTHTLQMIVTNETRNPFKLPAFVPSPGRQKKQATRERLRSIVRDIVQTRRESGEDKGDLLSMMLLSTDEDGNRLSEEDLIDEALTIFLAGHDTTANTITWAWTMLAAHPAIEQRLHEEIDQVLDGRPPTLADIPKLTYTNQVLHETLRKYPAAWQISRHTLEPIPLPSGYTIPEDYSVMIPIHALHHDERYFADPHTFNPDRFAPENEETIPKYAFIPFIYGPRVCIGNQFARMEALLLITSIAQRYRLRLLDDAPIGMRPLLTLNPARGIPVCLEKR